MPIRTCPRCKMENNYSDWNIIQAKCNICGFSLHEIIENPSKYQKKKINKHRYGSESGSTNNWIFDVDSIQLIDKIAAHGSTTNSMGVIIKFDDIIGHKQTESEKKTSWAAIVLNEYPEHSHAIPIDPQMMEGTTWTCVNCGHIHINDSPMLCKKCGKHPWIKEE